MIKKLGVSILTVNAINACGFFKDNIKDAVIEDFKKKIKVEDEKKMEYIKSLITDETTVISHTNTLNNDEFLKENTLVLEKATDEREKKVYEMQEKNLKKIIDSAKYGNNSRFYVFNIKVNDNIDLCGIIEIDESKVIPNKKEEFKRLNPLTVDGLKLLKLFQKLV